MTPAATSRSAASWAAAAGVAMTPIAIACALHDLGQVVDVADRARRRHVVPTLASSMSTIAGDGEAALAEPAVAGERLAEVAGADDDDRPVVGQAELAADLVDEVLDLVADAAGAVAAEVGEVLADLGGVHAGQLGQPLGRDRVDVLARRARAGSAGRPAGGRPWPRGCAGALGQPCRRQGTPTCTSSQSPSRSVRWARASDIGGLGGRADIGVLAAPYAAVSWSPPRPRSPAAATLVAVAFTFCTLDRWLSRRRRHDLAWTVALAMFAIGLGALWLGASTGWHGPTFRVFYLFGAVLNVPWLALGTVYLLAGQRTGDRAVGLALTCRRSAAGVHGRRTAEGHRSRAPTSPRRGRLRGRCRGSWPQSGRQRGGARRVRRSACRSGGAVRARPPRGDGLAAHPKRLAAGNALIALGTLISRRERAAARARSARQGVRRSPRDRRDRPLRRVPGGATSSPRRPTPTAARAPAQVRQRQRSA